MTLYDLIADERRKYPTPAATATLDMVVTELGKTRDNLKDAVRNLDVQALPPGGKKFVDELVERARAEGLDDLDYGPDPYAKGLAEPLDEATAGIGAWLALSSLAIVALAVAAVVVGLNAIFSSNG